MATAKYTRTYALVFILNWSGSSSLSWSKTKEKKRGKLCKHWKPLEMIQQQNRMLSPFTHNNKVTRHTVHKVSKLVSWFKKTCILIIWKEEEREKERERWLIFNWCGLIDLLVSNRGSEGGGRRGSKPGARAGKQASKQAAHQKKLNLFPMIIIDDSPR